MPRGFLTEEGPHPEFADQYGAGELPADSVRDRTEQNVLAADATLWFGVTTTLRAQETVGACHPTPITDSIDSSSISCSHNNLGRRFLEV